jgi:hypothetical protein
MEEVEKMYQTIAVGGDVDEDPIPDVVAQQSGDLLGVLDDAFDDIIVEGEGGISVAKEKSRET